METAQKEKLRLEAQAHVDSVIPDIRTNLLGTQESLVSIRRDLQFKLDGESQSRLRPQS